MVAHISEPVQLLRRIGSFVIPVHVTNVGLIHFRCEHPDLHLAALDPNIPVSLMRVGLGRLTLYVAGLKICAKLDLLFCRTLAYLSM